MSTISCSSCLAFLWIPVSDALTSALQSNAAAVLALLWNWATGGIGNVLLLGRNAEALDREMGEIVAIRDDLARGVVIGEVQHMKRTHQVQAWLARVEALELKVAEFRATLEEAGSSSSGAGAGAGGFSSSSSLRSKFLLGRSAAENLEELRRLRAQRVELTVLVSQAPPDPVVDLPSSSASIVGGEETLSKIRSLLEDDGVGIIGIYGMGGIGKTTLLKAINSEFLQKGTRSFDLVIWATVSKELNVLQVQEEIGFRLGYSRPSEGQGQTLPATERDRAAILFGALSPKKFLLLLDDVWEALDFGRIGIPLPNGRNRCKIAFTTRSIEVCNDMDAQDKVKVHPLDKHNARKLFEEKLGRRIDLYNSSTRGLAEAVVAKCSGLPLALLTVGRAMADATSIGEWEEALEALKGTPNELRGMKEVLTLLKFSFDKLKDASARDCLLYCALFPEDHDIDIEQLIEYWIGEGFLDARHCYPIGRARNKGLVLVTTLKSACLLENGWVEGRHVKLHDTVREMALWIASSQWDKTNVFLVNSGLGLTHVPLVESWVEARRVSLMHNKIDILPREPNCCNLLTLLLNDNILEQQIDSGFFQFMTILRILDLSNTKISVLPPGISSLVELQYLNLSNTCLSSLPREVGKLVKLRQLHLEDTSALKSIPCEVVSTLTCLQSLNLFESGYDWRWEWNDGSIGDERERQVCLKDLEGLEQLTELGLGICSLSSLQNLLSSKRLSTSVNFLHLEDMESLSSVHLSACFAIMNGLKKLLIEESPHLEELIFHENQLLHLEYLRLWYLDQAMFVWHEKNVVVEGPCRGVHLQNLRRLEITDCNVLRDITWVRELPCIEIIDLSFCSKLEELVVVGAEVVGDAEHENNSALPKLRSFYFRCLTNLKSICRHPLLLSSLETLFVYKCPLLNKLPFGPHSAKNIKRITGHQEWWDQLQWDCDDIRSIFFPHFTAIGHR